MFATSACLRSSTIAPLGGTIDPGLNVSCAPTSRSGLTFRGRVVEVSGDEVDLEVWGDTGAVLMPATAYVRLPRG